MFKPWESHPKIFWLSVIFVLIIMAVMIYKIIQNTHKKETRRSFTDHHNESETVVINCGSKRSEICRGHKGENLKNCNEEYNKQCSKKK